MMISEAHVQTFSLAACQAIRPVLYSVSVLILESKMFHFVESVLEFGTE